MVQVGNAGRWPAGAPAAGRQSIAAKPAGRRRTGRPAAGVPFAFLLLVACVTTSVPVSAPAAIEQEQELQEIAPQYSKFLDISSGYANDTASIGGDTGVRNAWFRFAVSRPGEAVVTLTPMGEGRLSVALFDDAVLLRSEREATEIGYRIVSSEPDSIATDVTPGVYYVKIACARTSERIAFVIAVTYRAEAPPPVAAPPARVVVPTTPRPLPKPAPKAVPPPSNTTIEVVAPVEPPPPPPVLIAPERREAIPLSSGATVTTDIGGESGYKWRWYEVKLTRKGKLRLDATANGAPVQIEIFDASGRSMGTLDVASDTATHSARHDPGTMFIRVGPAAGDVATSVTLEVKVAVAPFIRK